ncbi:MAG: lipoprotein [Candidatus Hodarchaeota archaeon]
MNRLILVLVLALFLAGCYTHINKVQDKWGPPAKVEDRGDTRIYYYYFPATDYGWGASKSGINVVELITTPEGKILKKRQYWKQPD